MRLKRCLAVLLILLLPACTTAPTVQQTGTNLLFNTTTGGTAASVDRAFYRVLSGCQQVLVGFEEKAEKLKQWGVALQTLGAIAGSVLLPIGVAAGWGTATTTGLGAFAGFTNTEISVVRNEALGAADVLMSRESVRVGMQQAIGKFIAAKEATPPNLDAQRAAVEQLRAACITYAVASPTALPTGDAP